jgi:hypothetical protein
MEFKHPADVMRTKIKGEDIHCCSCRHFHTHDGWCNKHQHWPSDNPAITRIDRPGTYTLFYCDEFQAPRRRNARKD